MTRPQAPEGRAQRAEGERSLILGTAGHIDHGKTALIAALTGVDTDRLPEEKARGITIDLGFAPLDLAPDLRLGVVDVPGHEGLVRTMVAGAMGIDVLLLVVAADEGVMPQTREHVAICDLLGIDRAVVALTKIDLVDEDVCDLAAEEVSELLAATRLAGAPVVPVAAPLGRGVEALREALREAAQSAAPRTPRDGPPRLPIDRVFTMKGFGTVVTGTLLGAPLSLGDAVELLPGGRRARVRGLQSFGEASESVAPGGRCAVNLQGVDVAEVSRGQTLTSPGDLALTASADVELAWLPDAPPLDETIPVEFLVGTAERRARLAPIGRGRPAPPFARVHLEGEPLPLAPGDRFVVRGFARTALGGSTLGGGRVLDAAPPRRRLSDPGLQRDLERLAKREPEADLAVRIHRSGLAGVHLDDLRRALACRRDVLEPRLAALAARGETAVSGAGRWLGREALASLEARLLDALAAYHAAEPLRPGMPRGALRGRLPENVAPDAGELVLARLVESGRAVIEGDLVRAASHAPRLSPAEEAWTERLRSEARAAGLEPPLLREWSERLGVAPGRLQDLLAHLERSGVLVRAPGDLFFDAEAVADLRARVVAHLREHATLDTPTYKGLIGTTRKYAVPLMELLDAERVTLRSGETRVLGSGAR